MKIYSLALLFCLSFALIPSATYSGNITQGILHSYEHPYTKIAVKLGASAACFSFMIWLISEMLLDTGHPYSEAWAKAKKYIEQLKKHAQKLNITLTDREIKLWSNVQFASEALKLYAREIAATAGVLFSGYIGTLLLKDGLRLLKRQIVTR